MKKIIDIVRKLMLCYLFIILLTIFNQITRKIMKKYRKNHLKPQKTFKT